MKDGKLDILPDKFLDIDDKYAVGAWNTSEIVVKNYKLSFLTCLLIEDSENVQLKDIIHTPPKSVNLQKLLEDFRFLLPLMQYSDLERYFWSCISNPENIKRSYKKYLEILYNSKKDNVDLNSNEKEMLQSILIDSINKAKTLNDLDILKEKIFNNPLIKKCDETSGWFNLFKKKLPMKIQEKVAQALKDAYTKIVNEDQLVLVETEIDGIPTGLN